MANILKTLEDFLTGDLSSRKLRAFEEFYREFSENDPFNENIPRFDHMDLSSILDILNSDSCFPKYFQPFFSLLMTIPIIAYYDGNETMGLEQLYGIELMITSIKAIIQKEANAEIKYRQECKREYLKRIFHKRA